MNEIKLNKPLFLNKRYIIFLDSDNKFSFKNKREALDFCIKVNRQIDESILLITEEINTMEGLYRLFYLADEDYRFKFKVRNSVDFIINRLAWMSDHSGSVNHDNIVFQSIIGCFSELTAAYGLIMKKASERKDTITKRRCALRIDIINIFKDQLFIKNIRAEANIFKIKKA